MRINKIKFPIIILVVFYIGEIFLSTAWINPPASQIQNVIAQTESTCLNRVNIPIEELYWIYVPESADELYTEENYFYLAGQLIAKKVVDASICPSGGLALNGYANACGMAAAKPAVIIIQNMVNEPILQAWKHTGVPPVLLKQLIRTESQFWPSQHNLTHYGFGHVTFMGMLNAIEWNGDLRFMLCPSSIAGICATNEGIASRLLSSLISTCDKCKYGIDPDSANRSVDILAKVVLGYCYQTEQLVFNATGWYSGLVVNYATIWKLTLMNYNSGPGCVLQAVAAAFKTTHGPVRWSDIVAQTSTSGQCLRGMYYANDITAKYFRFPLT
jgi:hypothetical protein